ncbi:hypothetical protein [Cellulomonas sp. KRMCY2]|uniref:hypothetical protein n=1 Tax=Cellulomonas sp. KRMCY2 TaxID=1304865 RepID=UPI00045E8ED3|nr:hypothetical protein [Cellulomonas sp. KRMCY2]
MSTGGGGTSSALAPSVSWDVAWEAALTALELDLGLAEQMLSLDHIADNPPRDPWAPPVGLGPLPATLADRARALLERQIETGRRLAEAADLSRRHSRAVQALRAAPPAVPVYLDTPA